MPIIDLDVGNQLWHQEEVEGYSVPTVPHYGTMSGADTYFKSRLFSENWEIADPEDKLKALQTSTRAIELLAYRGRKENPEQLLFFPRAEIDGGRVPSGIVTACYENALALLNGVNPEVEVRNLAATGQGYGGTRTTYDRSFTQEHLRAGIASVMAWSILRPFLADPSSVRLFRDS